MAIARTKILIQDDLMRPRPAFRITYTGPNPTRLYHEVPALLAAAFRVHTGQVQEKKVAWTKGETEKFSVMFELDKDLDNLSYYFVELEMSGSESKGYGTATMALKDGVLRTEYPQDTMWERSLLYEILRMIWHSMFYERKRTEWLHDGRSMLATFVDEVKKLTHEWKGE